MLCADLLALFGSGSNQRSSGQVIGLSEEPSGALVDCSNGLLTEDTMMKSCNLEVVIQIVFHALSVDSFEMTSCHHPGR